MVKQKKTLYFACLLIGVFILLGILSSVRQRVFPQELSSVEGVSLQYAKSFSNSHSTSSGFATNGESHFYSSGITIEEILAKLADPNYPIILKTKLPKNKFVLDTRIAKGTKSDLLQMVSKALKDAFDLEITIEPHEANVLVMTYPDTSLVGLTKSDITSSRFFHKSEGTKMICPFESDMKGFALYLNHMTYPMRNTDTYKKYSSISSAVIDETGMNGFYSGQFEWDHTTNVGIFHSAEQLGFIFNPDKRTVPCVLAREATKG